MNRIFPSRAGFFSATSVSQDEPEDIRLEKAIVYYGSPLIIAAAVIWGATFAAFGETLAGLLSLSYAGFTLVCLFIARRTYTHRWYLTIHFILGLLIPFVHMILLGGFWNSGAVVIWSLVIPMAALMFYGRRGSIIWWLAYAALLGLGGLLQPWIQHDTTLPLNLVRAFFVMNIAIVSGIVLLVLSYFLRKKDEAFVLLRKEEEKSERLLLNVLPKEIAAILKQEERVIADHFPQVSILFADLVGFTPLTASMDPIAVVSLLNEVFSAFDALVESYGVEKIRTIGDSYMVAAGVPVPIPDHAHRLARMALDMQRYLIDRAAASPVPLSFRIGLNSGPVIGGVIGRRKFVYDIWGEAVNLASRMESQGVPGQIQVAESAYRLLRDDFSFEPRGEIDVKGVGKVRTWFLKEINHEPRLAYREQAHA